MRLHYFQHEPFENPGSISEWAKSRGFTITSTHFYKDEAIAVAPDEVDLLVVMGGSMNADEEAEFLWMAQEKAFIRTALGAGKYVLGICLGAQLIARVLEAHVTKNPHKEIGWFPVRFVNHSILSGFPESLTVFHWHGDTFEIPEGALKLASSAACPNQAYLWNERALGLQFHMETTEAHIRDFAHFGDAEIAAGGKYVQSAAELLEGLPHAGPMRHYLHSMLDKWLEKAPFFKK